MANISSITLPSGATYDLKDKDAARNTLASTTENGLMSKEDKEKLDAIGQSTTVKIVRWT